jgi:hypothetical protein
MRRFVSILCLIGAAIALPAVSRADELNADDTTEVRDVIQAQLAAFEADDAPRAFSFATPQLQEAFGSAESFLSMVRNSYPVVYHHVTVAFLKPDLENGTVVQAVHFTDDEGVLWVALYHLERQQDSSWRISGCQAVQTQGRAA